MSAHLVADCSVTSGWFLQDEVTEDARRLLECCLSGEVHLIVPDLWWYETINVLRNAGARGRIAPEDARKALFFLEEIPLETVHSSRIGHAVILNLAQRHALSAYDATYLALAETRGTALVTADKHLIDLRTEYPWITSPGSAAK